MPQELDPDGQKFLESLAQEGLRAKQERAGKFGDWCAFCGSGASGAACGCKYRVAFNCEGKRACSDCREAMRTVSTHLDKLFAAHPHNRVSSVRNKLFHALWAEAKTLGESEPSSRGVELAAKLGDADDFDSKYERAEFRRAVLASFSQVRFLDFKALAAGIERWQQDRSMAVLITRLLAGKL